MVDVFDFTFQWFLVGCILFCATVVQGSVGFGFGLIAAPLCMLIFPELLPGPMIVAGLLLNIAVVLRGWRLIEYGLLPWLMLGFLPGLWLGAVLLQILTVQQTAFLFGFLVLSAVGMSVWGWQPRLGPVTLVPAGLFSAILSITTTMNGPPIALALQTLPGARFRHTLALFFTLAGFLTLASLAMIQRFGSDEIWRGVKLMPPILLGLGVSRFVSRWLDAGKTQTAILLVAALSGVAVILRGWFYPM